MRVLFTTWAWPSHLYAMVPLAWACRAAGHEVLVVSQPELAREMISTGLPSATVGADVDAADLVRGYVLPSARSEELTGQAKQTGKGPRAMRMFLAHAESMVDDLVTLARDWRPDLIVHEPTALAGPIAASAIGVPSVRHLYGTDLLLRARGILPELLAPLGERHELTDLEPFGVATVDPTPTSLQVPTDYRRIPMRYVPFNGSGPAVVPLPARTSRPRVCVTWGHTMAKLDPSLFLLPEILSALGTSDVEVVAAVSAAQRPLVDDVPDNATVLVDTPVDAILPSCDLLVGHGGAGTILTTLSHGLPLLLVPRLPDHAGHSGQVRAAGVGEVLDPGDLTPETLRESVDRVLAGHAPDRARAVAEEMRVSAPPADVVAELAALAAVPTPVG
ncbi:MULTISPECIES: nucleotide disphospho-sugar-binding domain-containing protein [Actinoalloteichus]|uniref:Glycosyl transferase, UDP-glucuronosyltransferase n=1 Tax=Actinoalloteichus fjordicus TaxID=1612552 RepID=A0AAC9PRQ3_9PSEU|nr:MULTISPECIES: nucleotide disphospho-sugar-binding domain-containing protein [Actinoalloteichus]APU14255.1 glycosyl transferase, UDP-glucuronosyltransferase [Actinoalloteichus fjordicus]APU20225.1 glycosyl transferase, UDP-glucuronosyltransferase [Actinoalloteichus sp. GBA129-24]